MKRVLLLQLLFMAIDCQLVNIQSNTPDVILSLRKWASPQASSAPTPLIIFVHQYAVMGGNGRLMEGMARRVASSGCEGWTFDLRGAGSSTGRSSWTNKDELHDLLSVINHALETTTKSIFLVGSSAGAPLAGAALDHSDRVIGGLFIGYVWGFWASILFGWAYSSIRVSVKPKFFIVGTADEFTTMNQYNTRIAELAGSLNEMYVIEGGNHFDIEGPQYDELVVQQILQFITRIQNNN
jgi:uncharacterized protein